MFTMLGFVLGKLIAGLPFLAKLWEGNQERKKDIRLAEIEAAARKDEAVWRLKELELQAETLKATELAKVELADAESFRAAILAAKPLDMPVPRPKKWWQALLDAPVILVNVANAAMRPYTGGAVVTMFLAVVVLEAYASFFRADLAPQVAKFAALPQVAMLETAFGLLVGHLFGERNWQHRMEAGKPA